MESIDHVIGLDYFGLLDWSNQLEFVLPSIVMPGNFLMTWKPFLNKHMDTILYLLDPFQFILNPSYPT